MTRVCRTFSFANLPVEPCVHVPLHAAATALRELNYTPIRNKPCRIMWSQRDPNNRKTGFGTIFVKNIPPSIDHKMLAETFSHVGSVSSARVAINESGGSRGYGYVTFESEKDAAAAVASMRNFEFEGFNVEVRPFVPKASRQRG
jgi:polyadenylate-binding protein